MVVPFPNKVGTHEEIIDSNIVENPNMERLLIVPLVIYVACIYVFKRAFNFLEF